MTKTVEFNSLSKLKEFYSTCRVLCTGWIIVTKPMKTAPILIKHQVNTQQLYQMYNNCTTNLQMYNFCTYCTNLVHSQYYLNTYYSTYFNVYYIMYCITYIITLTKRAQPKCKSLSAMCTNQWSSSYTLNRAGPLFSVHTNTLIKNNLKGHIMFGTLISDTFKFAAKIVGESVHQLDEAYEGTKNIVVAVATDISNIPSAIVDGYNEELFEKKPTPTDSVAPDEPTTVA